MENQDFRNPIEASIADIWARLLEVKSVGIEDNFLLLGGESLLAMQAASEIRLLYDCEISMRSIFVKTVAEVAAEVAGRVHAQPGSHASTLDA